MSAAALGMASPAILAADSGVDVGSLIGVALALVALVAFALFFGFVGAAIFSRKGRPAWLGFVLAVLLGILGIIIAVLVRPTGQARLQHAADTRSSQWPPSPEIVKRGGILVGAYVLIAVLKFALGSGGVGTMMSTLFTIVTGILIFVAVLGGLYWMASQLPEPWRERMRTVVFIGPALLLLLGLVAPALLSVFDSLYDKKDRWYGLRNYGDIFGNDDNIKVFSNTLWWGLIVTVLSTTIGIVIARFADRMRGEPIAKALIFLPTAISMVGAGIIWNFVFSGKQYGLLNSILPGDPKFFLQDRKLFGIDSPWVPGLNSLLIMVVVIWIQAGFCTVVISAALKGVPDDLVEAARIDGATDRQAFFRVVLPYIKGTIITVSTTTVLAVLKIFDVIQTMGKGGLFGTSTIANQMYETAFTAQNDGLGAAWAVLLFLLVIPIVFVNSRNQRAMREGR